MLHRWCCSCFLLLLRAVPLHLDRSEVIYSRRAPTVNLPFRPEYSSSFTGPLLGTPSRTHREHSRSMVFPRGPTKSKRMLPVCMRHSRWKTAATHLLPFQSK